MLERDSPPDRLHGAAEAPDETAPIDFYLNKAARTARSTAIQRAMIVGLSILQPRCGVPRDRVGGVADGLAVRLNATSRWLQFLPPVATKLTQPPWFLKPGKLRQPPFLHWSLEVEGLARKGPRGAGFRAADRRGRPRDCR